MTTSVEAIQHVFKENGVEDDRYVVQWENTGHPDGRWAVARFKGHWVGESHSEATAWSMARSHAERGEG